MKGTTTRARTGRTAAADRRPAVGRTGYVAGANALKLDYADDLAHDLAPDDLGYDDPAFVDDLARTGRRAYAEPVPTYEPRRRGRARTTGSTLPAVSPPLPISLPRAPFLILMVSLVVIGVVGVLVLNTKINENAFRLDSLRNEQSSLDLREQQLNQNLADLEAPGNLRAAAARLGLVPAGAVAFISLPNGTVVGVPQPASGYAGAGSTAVSGR